MLLECRHIDFAYPGNPAPVLKDLCLRLESPGFHALFGPSGVGKTSLARLLAGGWGGITGDIDTQGVDTVLYSHNQERLPGWSSVGRHLARITPDHNVPLKEMLVTKFELLPYLDHRFHQLSLGQQNRINLLRYLVQDFQVLIMDESLANVDEQTRSRIVLTMKETFPEVIFIYISHNVVEVAKFCKDIWVLRDVRKTPQAVRVRGRDFKDLHDVDLPSLEKTMLEMVNAA